ncbi:MAG: ATP synthase F1 subunit gamma [Bacteroidales bacterium]|nr:ATP synthase F1 subunit gamma [Bacteroidales bacterium]
MASLREIKDRIGSVRSTLKITGAMKLVASAKLRKAQAAAQAMQPYESTLSEILSKTASAAGGNAGRLAAPRDEESASRTAVVVIASNSSLCGAFNANVVKEALQLLSECGPADVYAVGRKAAESLRRAGFAPVWESSSLVGHPAFEEAAALARMLSGSFCDGRCGKVLLVYNHFVSTASQRPVVRTFLPFEMPQEESALPPDFILEPDASAILDTLIPQVLETRVWAAVLDSVAAEHAARTVAMQTASDNAETLLSDLTLEYNKGRQQKITSEILDLLGGKAG